MKDQLLTLYKRKQADFTSIMSEFPDDDLAGPFLMSPNEKYPLQRNPLLIIGQETNGWMYNVEDLEKQMKHYEDFNVGITYKSSPFWNITRKIETALGSEPYSCAWTNVNKFDLDAGRPFGAYEKAISTVDNVLIEEIQIAKPKVCLFYTGPSFDNRLKEIFNGIEFIEIPGWTLRQLCQLKHPLLPELSFRSYHPKSLRLRYLEEDFVDFIAGQVSN